MAFGLGEIMALFNILRSEYGAAQANEQNIGQYDQGAGILGLPAQGGPRPGQSHADWANAQNPSGGLGDQLLGILGQQTGYGNQALQDLMVSGVKGYSDLYGRTQDSNDALLRGYQGVENQARAGGGGLERMLQQGYGDLTSGFGQRESDVMGLLRGMGGAERMDINEAFANTAAGNQSALRSRGLGSSTIAGGQATADARARSRELGAFEERLRTQQAGTLANLRGDTLGATERGLGAQTALGSTNLDRLSNLGLSRLGAQQTGDANLAAVQEAGLRNYLASQGGIADFNLNQYGNQMNLTGQNAAQQLGWLQQLNAQGPNPDQAWSGALNYWSQKNMPTQQSNWYDPLIGGVGSGIGTGVGTLGSLGAIKWLAPSLLTASDVAVKHNIWEVDPSEFLDRLDTMPVYRWEYDNPDEPGGEHVGPMAQDFKAAFGLGDDDKKIAVVDALGVAFATIKALRQEVNELKALIAR